MNIQTIYCKHPNKQYSSCFSPFCHFHYYISVSFYNIIFRNIATTTLELESILYSSWLFSYAEWLYHLGSNKLSMHVCCWCLAIRDNLKMMQRIHNRWHDTFTEAWIFARAWIYKNIINKITSNTEIVNRLTFYIRDAYVYRSAGVYLLFISDITTYQFGHPLPFAWEV